MIQTKYSNRYFPLDEAMHLYCLTAVDREGNAVAACIGAENPDDATTKAVRRLPKGGRITHLIHVCNADLISFNRNKLDKLLSVDDRIEFTAKALLSLVDVQQQLMAESQATVKQLQSSLDQLKNSMESKP